MERKVLERENKNIRSKDYSNGKHVSNQIKKDILDGRSKQSKLINQIKDDIKKIRETNISMIGLEQISPNSVKKLQEKREKFTERLAMTVKDLNILIENITKLESKYKQTM